MILLKILIIRSEIHEGFMDSNFENTALIEREYREYQHFKGKGMIEEREVVSDDDLLVSPFD